MPLRPLASASALGIVAAVATLATPTRTPAAAADGELAFEVRHTLRPTLRHLELTATASEPGHVLTVKQGGRPIGFIEPAEPGAGGAAGGLVVPLPVTGAADAKPFVVTHEGEVVAEVPVPDTLAGRRSRVRTAELHTHFVFSEGEFPEVEFEQPGWVESLIGPFTIEARYFDDHHREVAAPEAPGRYGLVMTVAAEGVEPIRRYHTLYRLASPIDWAAWKGVEAALPAGFGLSPEMRDASVPAVSDWAKWEVVDRIEHFPHAAALAGVLADADVADAPFDGAATYWNADEVWWIDLRKKLGYYAHRYLTYLPEGYDASAEAWPLVIYLHGVGARGHDLERVRRSGLAAAMEAGRRLPAVVVAPQADAGAFWVPARVEDLVEEVTAKHRVDPARVYLTGDGMGAYGTWFVASFYPRLFAGIAPVGGGGELDLLPRVAEAGVRLTAFDLADRPGPQTRLSAAFDEMGGEAELIAIDAEPRGFVEAVYGGEEIVDAITP